MIYIPEQILIGTDKYDAVEANKSYFSLDDKRVSSLVKDYGLNNICYRPTKHSLSSVVTKQPGFVFHTYLLQKLLDENLIQPNAALMYLEHVGTHLYLLMVDNLGVVHSEVLTEVLVSETKNEVSFDSDALDLVIRRITNFYTANDGVVSSFISTSATIDTDAFFRSEITEVTQERLRNIYLMNEIGSSLLFRLSDEGGGAARLETGILAEPVGIELPGAHNTTPFLTDLIVQLLCSEADVVTTELLSDKHQTLPVKQYFKKKNIGRSCMAVALALAVTACTLPSYLAQKKLEDEIANQIVTVKRQIDEFSVYRDLILKDGLDAEMSLKQIALALGVFTENRESLQWYPSEIQAKTTNVSLMMTGIGGTSNGLADFAKNNGLVHFYNDNKQVLGYGIKRYAINKEVYRTPVDDEIRFLEDMISYMFDYTTLSIAQRTSHENWTSALVDIDFNCWLPENFEYFSTQLYPRNFGFATLNAAWTDQADVDGEPLTPCGYSGKLQLEIYGHQGQGFSTTQINEEKSQTENL